MSGIYSKLSMLKLEIPAKPSNVDELKQQYKQLKQQRDSLQNSRNRLENDHYPTLGNPELFDYLHFEVELDPTRKLKPNEAKFIEIVTWKLRGRKKNYLSPFCAKYVFPCVKVIDVFDWVHEDGRRGICAVNFDNKWEFYEQQEKNNKIRFCNELRKFCLPKQK